jgi:ATP-dependent Lhr-like helicase
MSGIQFIREQDYAATMLALEQPSPFIIWLPAIDPAQPWGKSLPHRPGKSFMNLPGTAVALHAGSPIAVFERQGKTLRVLDGNADDGPVLDDVLRAFAYQFSEKRIFPTQNRVSVRQYPPGTAEALTRAGFVHEVQDFVLYRRHA